MATTHDILKAIRVLVGDTTETRYTDSDIEMSLGCALIGVNFDLGRNYSYSAGTRTITPDPDTVATALIAIATAMVMAVGEETASAFDGGGMIWRSGMTSISLAGYHKAVQDSVKKFQARYDRILDLYLVRDLPESSVIDLYSTTDPDVLGVN